MTQKPRAVRFSAQEEGEMQRFLDLNSFLDFSTLARVAIKRFMQDPKIEMKSLIEATDGSGSGLIIKKALHKEIIIKNSKTSGENKFKTYNQ